MCRLHSPHHSRLARPGPGALPGRHHRHWLNRGRDARLDVLRRARSPTRWFNRLHGLAEGEEERGCSRRQAQLEVALELSVAIVRVDAVQHDASPEAVDPDGSLYGFERKELLISNHEA